MKSKLIPLTATLLLTACSDEPQKPIVTGNDYIGTWFNPNGQQSTSPNDVIINDRVIIEPTDQKDTYSVSILSKGVFTPMIFKPENGLLCAPNDACFQLADGKLRLGSKNGILSYERE